MIREAVVLAGGLGTRLQNAVPDLPKCLAPVAGKPFLGWLIEKFSRLGIERFVFALGFRNEAVEAFLATALPASRYACSVEPQPLGTGGALALALPFTSSPDVLVLNGDTYFAPDLAALERLHREAGAVCTLALKPMTRVDRYGTVRIDAQGRVQAFVEKKFVETGLVNGGVYALNAAGFAAVPVPERFSFETDFLQARVADSPIFGRPDEAWFIDIGIPEDFARAQTEIPRHA